MTETPCEVWFYHLEGASLAEVLPSLLAKALARGWRVLVRSPSVERLDELDGALWAGREDGFLPHGLASEPHAERQPVLLTADLTNPNGAKMLLLLDGAESGELVGFARCVLVFDGGDETAVAGARARWRSYKAEGLPTSYWRQTKRGAWERAG